MHVLLIEDNDPNAYLARFLLERRGHSVDLASTGAAAVERTRGSAFDVILLDLRLPDGDGCDFARQFETRGAPIIAVSAHALPADHKRALELGCVGFIEKPIDVATFVERIESIVAGLN